MDDIDAFLSRESKSLDKDGEILRILGCFPLDAYSVLDLLPGAAPPEIRGQYRRKSLLIHPDKTTNPKAPDAFARLKAAEAVLLDETRRQTLDEAFTDARKLLLAEKDHAAPDTAEFRAAWREKTKIVLVDSELRRRRRDKLAMQQQGRERDREEQEIEERKRKREEKEVWENTRDERISNWRSYRTTTEAKKKKPKKNVLG
ncbi:chaperone protein dnaJ [Limtongia smithiae]|uniref:chaperone protein dnaJ n=1 Tax=Limtongia smithiae TaxID=1125753 RepID=UPI0034CE5F73